MSPAKLPLGIAILFLFQSGFSQQGTRDEYNNGFYIKQYSEITGLVNNRCKSVFEDSKGFLWISTFQGLSRFDGRNFTNYGLRQGLPGFDISQVSEDSLGYIYIATTKGIVRYTGPNAKNDSCFYIYKQTTSLGSPIWGIQAIDSTTLVFQRVGAGLLLLKNGKLSTLWERTLRYGRSIFKDRNNNIYVYTGDTIRIYDKKLNHVNDIYFPNAGFISFYSDKNTGVIHVYSNSKAYQLSLNGLEREAPMPDSIVWFCKAGREKKIFYSKRERTGLWFSDSVADSKVLDLSGFPLYSNELMLARDKSVWMPTNAGGIFKVVRLPYREIIAPQGGYTRNLNNRTVIEYDDRVTKTLSGDAVYRKLKTVVLKSVFLAKSGIVWFCTNNGIYKHAPGKTVEHYSFEGDNENYNPVAKEISGVAEDNKGGLWFYGYSGVIHFSDGRFRQYTTRNGLGRDILVRSLVIDNSGTTLLTDYFNLFRVQGDTIISIGNELNLPHYIPNRIKTDNNGNAWIDYNKKIYKIEKQLSGKFIITDSILPFYEYQSAEISKFEFDGQNNCWVGYTGGKIQVFFPDNAGHYSNSNSITYTVDDGLVPLTAGEYSFFPDSEGNMTIVSKKNNNEKIFVFDMAAVLERKILLTPQVSLTNIFVNHKIPGGDISGYLTNPEGLPEHLNLRYRDNNITFSYSGVLLSNPADVVYRVMLQGYDKEWRTTTGTSLDYTNLPAGEYTFLVKAANANGMWSSPARYDFTVLLPWYKTWWATTLWVLLTGFILLLLFRLRIREIKKTEALNNLKKNSLFKSRLIGLIGHDMMTPLRYIAKVALQLRNYNEKLSKQTTLESLEEINNTASQLHFFGQSIIQWIKLQSEGYTPQVQDFDLKSETDELIDFHLPLAAEKKNQIINELPESLECSQDPVLIKIILHNLMLNANKFTSEGTISIKGEAGNKWLTLSVMDTGRGMDKERVDSLNRMQPIMSSPGTDKEAGWGMGYVLIMDLLKFSKGSLHVESKLKEGTTVTVKLPLITRSYNTEELIASQNE